MSKAFSKAVDEGKDKKKGSKYLILQNVTQDKYQTCQIFAGNQTISIVLPLDSVGVDCKSNPINTSGVKVQQREKENNMAKLPVFISTDSAMQLVF